MDNRVEIAGKICKVSTLRYTVSGLAVRRMQISIPQEFLGKPKRGEIEVVLTGDLATGPWEKRKIGVSVDRGLFVEPDVPR